MKSSTRSQFILAYLNCTFSRLKSFISCRKYFSLGKMRRNVSIFTENLWQTKGSCSHKVLLSIGRSEICLALGSQTHFVQILQKLFAVFDNLKRFPQICKHFCAGN
jgi:hypothetical protein